MLFALSALILTSFGQSAAGNAARIDEQRRLEACIAKLDDAPEEAHEDGLAWIGEGGRPMAHQCAALALVELGHAAEGAVRLETLANAANGGSLAQRVIYLTQAGNAWVLAGQPEAAITTLDNAIRLSPTDPHLKLDRAAALIELARWDEAGEALELASDSLPRNTDLLKMRAEVNLNLGDLADAERDIVSAMEIDRTDVATLLLRGRIREAIRLAGESVPVDEPLLLIGGGQE